MEATTTHTTKVRAGHKIRATLDNGRTVAIDVRYVEGRGRSRSFVGTDLDNADQWYTIPAYHVTRIERV